ncbi:hypothetical protein A3B60_04240 [Candidatus Peregrinibacteria bacterium RIFCSPLOWO2_01_FULL_39_12]|nr:MAG: hypothetical protein A3I58_03960 [Candidatus Peregrinibacteria bacterium RIFCSPLOWO2_02_FULL_39_10]OGJ43081.1 MAG: hypothetical protein A3B60_04240 [Candidatus Peregrinibacteria bacterium RIFCSPLOWO2_01_FULL_39_12]
MMQILITRYFLQQAKKLKRKFPHLKEDLIKNLESFVPGNEIHIKKSIFKIRIKSQDLNKGKSGGLRSYVYLYQQKNLIIPICIYFKSEQESITEKVLDFHSKKTLEEIITKIAG